VRPRELRNRRASFFDPYLNTAELAEQVLYTVEAEEGGDGERATLFDDILDGVRRLAGCGNDSPPTNTSNTRTRCRNSRSRSPRAVQN
jgi:hypothetical protein